MTRTENNDIRTRLREVTDDMRTLRLRLDALESVANKGRGAVWAAFSIGGFIVATVGMSPILARLLR